MYTSNNLVHKKSSSIGGSQGKGKFQSLEKESTYMWKNDFIAFSYTVLDCLGDYIAS